MVGEISCGARMMLNFTVAMRLIGCLEKLLGQSSSTLDGNAPRLELCANGRP